MEPLTNLILTLLCLTPCLCWDPKHPEAKNTTDWMKKHKSFLEESEHMKSHIKVVFIGASIMEFWQTEGKQIWSSYYVTKSAVDYGIGGDTTSNVLWRVLNHELDGLNPKVIVLQVGGYDNKSVIHSPSLNDSDNNL